VAGTKVSKRNRNRFRKVYPYLRRSPRYELVTDKEVQLEVAAVIFTNQSQVSYSFSEKFPAVPTITAISCDSLGTSTADVNVFISAITTTNVTLETSQAFTGTVHFQAMWIQS
jgi:hypothetical protein